MPPTVLILGSGPNATDARDWGANLPFDEVVAINNAHLVRPDWTIHIHPEDFPPERRPARLAPGQRVVTAAAYVPLQNLYGGFIYAGGTMAFTAAYWALAALRPRLIAFLGCDMVYPATGNTHFYGQGAADPLRPDISLRSLPAKARRFQALAARDGAAVVNLSRGESVLPYPRATLDDLRGDRPRPLPADPARLTEALDAEAEAGYLVPSGRYWLEESRFDRGVIDAIDALWLTTYA